METAEYIETLDQQGQLLAAAAEQAGTDAPVPTCPGWQVRDLLRHMGVVHRWATTYVIAGHKERRPLGSEPDLDSDALLHWFREGHSQLVAALNTAPKDLECLAFLPAPSPLAFWARRQAHETAVHRVDADSALGAGVSPVGSEFAADGVDELLRGFHARDRSRVRTEGPRVLRVRATDSGDVWTMRLSDDPPRTERNDEGPADCEVSGPAEQLYLALWNRLPLSSLTMSGDDALVRLWQEKSGI
ncbi:maleylpyruvate isomerase family mycothiol-dependent enzyme [Streptomyces sp. ISL-100]|uniref:maleylpyruvate isomerase family mycothiol-dependent enzyme n=1 Tax=Streptomyces sp. ISL-100 TaxID=2819173 RepID=UPI001BE66BE3|nr:maleylpyruvate isomerase family mycothiol-dependent enzyme [Streptomyces sp. ISL-100]MBT2394566.1 maleylpyruvate isomerase family mycothiol-dependent enzyme [Streptomyces sp. ISL-100]